MDPSLYQQRQQQNRVSYPFTGNPQAGSTNVMGVGAYPQQYLSANMTNNAGYLQSSNGINPMMPISGRPVYPVPVASMTSMTTNGMPAAKRVALAPNPPMQNVFSNITQTPGQNQLYATTGGFPSQQMMSAGRSTAPTQSFVNTDIQNIDGKNSISMQANTYATPIQNINKYYGQFQQQTPTKANAIANNFNNLLNQPQSPHSQQNQAMQNSIQQDDSQVDWLELGDDDDIVYDFNCSNEASSSIGGNMHNWNSNSLQGNLHYPSQNSSKSYPTINNNIQRDDSSFNFSTITPGTVTSSGISQNLSPKSIQYNSMGMLPRSPDSIISSNMVADSSSQSVLYNQSQSINLNQQQTATQIGQYNKIATKDHTGSNSIIGSYPQPSAQSSISTELSSTSSIQNAVIDSYKQSPQTTVDSSTVASIKSNTLMGHIESMQRTPPQAQENQTENTPITNIMENQNLYTSNVQITSSTSTISAKDDDDLTNSSNPTNFPQQSQQQNKQTFNSFQNDKPKTENHVENSSISNNLAQNLRLPVNTGIAGRRIGNSRQVSRQSEKSPVTAPPPVTSSQSPNPAVPTKNAVPKPPKVNYSPKIRRVESHGGLDLKVFEKFSLPLHLPGIQDLGAVDIHALKMSLKCGMKLEVTNALNTLTTLSYYRNALIDLKLCGDLLDILFDMILEYLDYVSPECTEENLDENIISRRKFKPYRQLYQISKQECEEFSEAAYEPSSFSEECLPSCEQCWCITNVIRNFSFIYENQEHLATHPRLLSVLMRILYMGEDDSYHEEKTKKTPETSDNQTKRVRKRAYDILELRKSVLIILSNIAAYLPLSSIYLTKDLLMVIADFLDCSDEYYAQVALEVFSKISVSYENRLRIGGCDEITLTTVFEKLVTMLSHGEGGIGLGGFRGMIPRSLAQDLPYIATLVMAYFNFAQLSGEVMRKKMVSTPGFISRILKLSMNLGCIRPGSSNDEDCIMLARRAMEMLKVLAKGNEESFLVYTEQLLEALLSPYIDRVVIKDLEAIIYPGDV
ncbi:15655_t:CDS:2 [Acaulospora morrowiae]|uniref:15655_t:CDS:1 n=1 Tax=Acaulospora morrowiae TaxID=94023 RepID=A0A9N9CTD0_9GLOM|nr:15655_t:CDS:2 [Acaulospora morrowiae]